MVLDTLSFTEQVPHLDTRTGDRPNGLQSDSVRTASGATSSPTKQRLCGLASGYRAIHIYTRYHGRRIEVRLRTREQGRL